MFGTGGGLTNPGGGGPVWTAVQTFMQKIVAAAGIELTSAIWSTLGAGATDVCVKVGTNVADASVNAAAKLLSVRTGLTGTEVEKAYVTKSGALYTLDGMYSFIPSNLSYLNFQSTGLILSTGQPQQNLTMVPSYGALVHTSLAVQSYLSALSLYSGLGGGATDVCVKVGSRIADGSVNAAAKLLSVRTGVTGTEVEKAFVSATGEVESTVAGSGIVLRSPDGTRYRVTVANGGTLSVAAA